MAKKKKTTKKKTKKKDTFDQECATILASAIEKRIETMDPKEYLKYIMTVLTETGDELIKEEFKIPSTIIEYGKVLLTVLAIYNEFLLFITKNKSCLTAAEITKIRKEVLLFDDNDDHD